MRALRSLSRGTPHPTSKRPAACHSCCLPCFLFFSLSLVSLSLPPLPVHTFRTRPLPLTRQQPSMRLRAHHRADTVSESRTGRACGRYLLRAFLFSLSFIYTSVLGSPNSCDSFPLRSLSLFLSLTCFFFSFSSSPRIPFCDLVSRTRRTRSAAQRASRAPALPARGATAAPDVCGGCDAISTTGEHALTHAHTYESTH